MAIKAAFRSPRPSQAFLAFYENDLATEVKAGENEGAVLRHDYVVREWVGPIEVRGSAEVRKNPRSPAGDRARRLRERIITRSRSAAAPASRRARRRGGCADIAAGSRA